MQSATHKNVVTTSSTPRTTPIMIPVCLAANTSVYNRSGIHKLSHFYSFTDLLPCAGRWRLVTYTEGSISV